MKRAWRQHKPSILAIIPARGGSKGVKNKNIRLLHGKPLIAYTIHAALKSKTISDVITTTDADPIIKVAQSLKCEVLRRPSKLAQDDTPMIPVVLHVLDTLQDQGRRYDYVVLLQPTCPQRSAEDIDQAMTLLTRSNAAAVIGVYRVFDEHPARMYRLKKNRLVPFAPSQERLNRQDLEPIYHRNGAIYGIRESVLRRAKTFFPKDSLAYEMPKARSINIDEELDFDLAEFLMDKRRG